MSSPNNTINWGQGAVNNDKGWGQAAANNSISWGLIHEDSWGHPETNLVGPTGPSYETEYQAVLNYATSLGYAQPTDAQKLKQNQLLKDLKAAGIWAKLDTFAVFANNGGANFGLIDWKRLTTYTAVNSPTFTSNVGFQGNGTSSYIALNYTPSVNGVNLTLNNNSMGAYSNIQNTASGTLMSSFATGSYIEIGHDGANNRIVIYNMNTSANLPSVGVNGQGGLFVSTRSISTAYSVYRNATLIFSPAQASNSLATGAMRLFSRSNNTVYSLSQASMAFAGSALNATEVTNLQTAFVTNYFNTL